MAYVRSAVERQALTEAINEAWALAAVLTFAGAAMMAGWLLLYRRGAGMRRPEPLPGRTGASLLLRPILYPQARPFRNRPRLVEPVHRSPGLTANQR
jgi:hypothetical protein